MRRIPATSPALSYSNMITWKVSKERERPHLVLLDLALPGIDGIDLMIDIAGVTDVPVIFLSAYGREENVTQALDMGAAEYIVKPFPPMELAARTRAELRKRRVPESPDPFVLGDLAVYFADRRVTLAGSPVQLTAIEYPAGGGVGGQRRAGADLRAPAPAGLGRGGRSRRAPHSHRPEQDTPPAGRRPGQPYLHFN